jgi:hypothetical protein
MSGGARATFDGAYLVGGDVGLVGVDGLEGVLAREGQVLFVEGEGGDLVAVGQRQLPLRLLPPINQSKTTNHKPNHKPNPINTSEEEEEEEEKNMRDGWWG